MVDAVEGGEEDDDDSEEGDHVTETGLAQSEEGKQPVFHHEIYDRLVNLMSRQGAYSIFFPNPPNSKNTLLTLSVYEPPDYGIDSKDITSFHLAQRDWSASRAHRAPILTLWSEPPGSAPTFPIGCLLFNGRLILDYAGNPLRAFRHLPLTISSAVKGFRLETWIRQDIHRLHIEDILARLRTWNTPNGRRPLHRRGDLTDRANAFRLKSGLITFRPRNWAVRLAARAYLDSLRTEAQRANNLAIDRDLTPDQLATLKELSKMGPKNAVSGSSGSVVVSTPTTVSAPTVVVTPISRPPRRHHPSPTPQPAPSCRHRPLPAPQPTPASSPTPAQAQDLPDSREDVPETCKESYILRDALEETVEHFKKLTRQNPQHTNTFQSYSSQWNALQAQFNPIWRSQRPREETPFLFKLRAWTGGIARWDQDWRVQVGGVERDRETEVFGEYMDATHDGTAYIGPGGSWRSTRDTWCNSHLKPTEGRWSQRDSTSEEGSEEDSEEGSEVSSDDEFDDAS